MLNQFSSNFSKGCQQPLTIFPGIPAWPLSPGVPCNKSKKGKVGLLSKICSINSSSPVSPVTALQTLRAVRRQSQQLCRWFTRSMHIPVPLAVLEIQAIQALQEFLCRSDSPIEAKTERPGEGAHVIHSCIDIL